MTETDTIDAAPGATDLGDNLALLLSHVLSPAGVATAVFAWLAMSGGSWAAGLAGVALYAVLPGLSLLYLKRSGVLADVYNPEPQLRQRILVVGAACYGAGYVVLKLSGAPKLMLWAGALYGCGALVVWLIDRYWKISIHSVGVGGGVLILAVAGDLWLLSPALLMVAWARLRLKAHTPAQVVGGLALGCALAASLRTLYL
ncbi:MAG: hypothetical protein ABIL09_21550 [Gemmatimonadota bacterium]